MTCTFLFALALVALTVAIHAAGLALLTRHFHHSHKVSSSHQLVLTWLLIRTAWMLILIHTIEISIWALFYYWKACLPDLESSFYFSGVTYTTIGYGDLVLTEPWRILGPIEGLIGILMCGLSAAGFFAIVNRVHSTRRGISS